MSCPEVVSRFDSPRLAVEPRRPHGVVRRAAAGRSWRRALAGLGGVVLVQAVAGVPVGELAHHCGFDPHAGLLRGGASALPTVAVRWLTGPPRPAVIVTPARPRALPQAG